MPDQRDGDGGEIPHHAEVIDRDFGRPATPDEIALWDIDVRPDGKGLPASSGTVTQGKLVFADNRAVC